MEEKEIDLLESDLLESYEAVKQVYERILNQRATFRDRIQDLDSMTYQLHNLYGAYEQLFELMANFFENQVGGTLYHTDLLCRMKTKIKGVRPALISESTYRSLDKLRRFHHFFRHAYTAKLGPDRVDRIVQIAIQLKKPFKQDVQRFLAQLR